MKIIVISDCDGCLTDGNFIYTEDGKVAKIYGAHDNDGVKILKHLGVDIQFISGDTRGFNITKKRIEDMKCNLDKVTESERLDYIKQYVYSEEYDVVVFFGDGYHDAKIKEALGESIVFITPNNGRSECTILADYVTESDGGHGAFLDLALYINDEYFVKYE